MKKKDTKELREMMVYLLRYVREAKKATLAIDEVELALIDIIRLVEEYIKVKKCPTQKSSKLGTQKGSLSRQSGAVSSALKPGTMFKWLLPKTAQSHLEKHQRPN